MKGDINKKQYEKPIVTRVRLSVEERVLQSCRSETEFNRTGFEPPACWGMSECLKTP